MEEKVMRNKEIAHKKTKEKSEQLVQPLYLKNDRANCGFSFETPAGLLNFFSADAEETIIVLRYLLLFPEIKKVLGYEEEIKKEE